MATNAEIMTSIRHGLRGIARFSGRDARVRFWPYAIGVCLVGMAIGTMAMVPILFGGLFRMRELAERYPDQFEVRQGQSSYSVAYIGNDPAVAAQILPDFRSFFVLVAIIGAAHIVLLAAACTRRLHDRTISGKWLVLPLLFSLPGMIMLPRLMEQVSPGSAGANPGFFGSIALIFAGNLLYLVSLLTLAILMMQRGTDGVNRFGPPDAN